jgi:DNA polymerase (family X)
VHIRAMRMQSTRKPAPDEEHPVSVGLLENGEIASRLEEVAQTLAGQGANPYRIEAYRHAARTVRGLSEPLTQVVRERGIAALRELPGIGEHLARSVHLLATTGRLPMLERLRGDSDPAELFLTVVGIGARTATRIQDELGIHTLEELEVAAHDGRLARLGIGAKRLAGIRDVLASRLGRIRSRAAPTGEPLPEVAEILDVDREYREKAARELLPKIAPRRFNPAHAAWLPVLHTQRGERHYTALFSNTARAHSRGRTRDWVVLYFDGRGAERQCTVISSERGALRGRRIVRGREQECLAHHGSGPS